MQKLTIATRRSPLALWQAQYVKKKLEQQHRTLCVQLLKISTQGDKQLASTLTDIGGKGLFIKELELAMQQGLADIAVHSAKDMPYQLPKGFVLGAILKRENAHDAFVANSYHSIETLPYGAKVGTCSLRRKAQLLARRPDLNIIDLRGNINTRLQKLDRGEYDAIILACAGLLRLGLKHRIKAQIPIQISVPAVGQGAIAIEIKADDTKTKNIIATLADKNSSTCVLAERTMNAHLKGSCKTAIAGFAEIINQQLTLTAVVGDITNKRIIKTSAIGKINEAAHIAEQVYQQLLQQGAAALLKQ